jgi:phenol 2-monooxygenase (NADPH)
MRFHSARAIRMSDGKPLHLGHVVRADGRWRLFAFADGKMLTDPIGTDIDSAIEVIAICQQTHRELSVELLPSMLLPRKGRYGLVDYEKVYCSDKKTGGDIFDLRGIDRSKGVLVIVRPDQYIAHVLPLDAHEELVGLFQRFMLPAY